MPGIDIGLPAPQRAGLPCGGVRRLLVAARSLARAGAEVTLAVRNTDAGAKTAEYIAQSSGNGNVLVSAVEEVLPLAGR